jgi:hypothetical protein
VPLVESAERLGLLTSRDEQLVVGEPGEIGHYFCAFRWSRFVTG